MPPLCPDCGWVLVKTEMVRHVIYQCWNEECPAKESKFQYPMYAIEGTEPYFKRDIKAWLNMDTPTEFEVTPKCKGSNCGHLVPCFHGCSFAPRNENLVVEYVEDSWAEDLQDGLDEAEAEAEASRLRGEPPWRMCPRCGRQMNYDKWIADGFKCQYEDCGYVTAERHRPERLRK